MLIKKLNSLLIRLFLLNYHLFRHERTSLTFFILSHCFYQNSACLSQFHFTHQESSAIQQCPRCDQIRRVPAEARASYAALVLFASLILGLCRIAGLFVIGGCRVCENATFRF